MQNLIERLWSQSRFSAVLVMEAGELIFETAVDLQRPRARSGRAFIDLKETVLTQVMGGGRDLSASRREAGR